MTMMTMMTMNSTEAVADDTNPDTSGQEQVSTENKTNTMVQIKTNYGSFVIELLDEKAPITTANFLKLVTEGYYEGTLFHRVIEGFVIQGGGIEKGMYQKAPTDSITNEATNEVPNDIYSVAMARLPSNPHSATNQFFINVAENAFLNNSGTTDAEYGYAVFGKIINGIDVVLSISKVPTEDRSGYSDVPINDVIIESATIIENDIATSNDS